MSEIAAAVDRVLDRHARKHLGVAVGVRAETELHTCGRRRVVADRPESPSANTIFEIGSITKVFTAVLLADLVQRGLVALEDPVQRYLPEGVRLPVRGQPVTLADLATHSAGFPGIPKGMLRRVLTERANPWATFAEADLLAAVPRTRLRAAPGRRVRYSNYGFGLLGYVLARVAGTSYEALVQERICRPLELVDTSTVVPDEKRERLAHAHDRRGRPVSYWDIPGLPGAGALHSTVDDLLAFLDLNLFLGDAPLALAARLTHAPRVSKRRYAFGLGWMRIPIAGTVAIFHDGGTGGFRSVFGFVEGKTLAAVVLSNCSRSVDRIGIELLKSLAA